MNQDINLVLKLMDSHKQEFNRRFDAMDKEMKDLKKEVMILQKWEWTTKGKVAGMGLIIGIIGTLIMEFGKSLLK